MQIEVQIKLSPTFNFAIIFIRKPFNLMDFICHQASKRNGARMIFLEFNSVEGVIRKNHKNKYVILIDENR